MTRDQTLPSAGPDSRPRCGNRRRDVGASLQRNVSSLRPERLPDGVRLETGGGFLTLRVMSDGIVRVTFSPGREFRGDQMAVLGPESPALNPFQSTPAAPPSVATTPTWTLRCDRHGRHAHHGEASRDGGWRRHRHVCRQRRTTDPRRSARRPAPRVPTTVQGEQTHHVQQLWQTRPDESLYGLGQRQEGKLDIKGYDFDLWQRNTVVYVPMIVSSRGYGLLWDNTSPSKFGDIAAVRGDPAAATCRHVREAGRPERRHVRVEHRGRDGDEDGSASCRFNMPAARDRRRQVVRGWQGQIVAPVTGDYQFQTYSNGSTRSGSTAQLRIDHYKQNWATEYDQFKVHLDAGQRYPIKITISLGTTLRVTWKTPPPRPRHVDCGRRSARHRLLLPLRTGDRPA